MAALKGSRNKGWETQRHKKQAWRCEKTSRDLENREVIWSCQIHSASDATLSNQDTVCVWPSVWKSWPPLHTHAHTNTDCHHFPCSSNPPPPALNASLVARLPGKNDVCGCALRWMKFHFLWLTAAVMLTSVQFALQILVSNHFQNEITMSD